MEAAVVALVVWLEQETPEPEGWNRSTFRVRRGFRRRPDLSPESEYIAG